MSWSLTHDSSYDRLLTIDFWLLLEIKPIKQEVGKNAEQYDKAGK